MRVDRIRLSVFDVPKEIIDTMSILFTKHTNNGTIWVTILSSGPLTPSEITFFQEDENEQNPESGKEQGA